jgi:hypothetical protein
MEAAVDAAAAASAAEDAAGLDNGNAHSRRLEWRAAERRRQQEAVEMAAALEEPSEEQADFWARWKRRRMRRWWRRRRRRRRRRSASTLCELGHHHRAPTARGRGGDGGAGGPPPRGSPAWRTRRERGAGRWRHASHLRPREDIMIEHKKAKLLVSLALSVCPRVCIPAIRFLRGTCNIAHLTLPHLTLPYLTLPQKIVENAFCYGYTKAMCRVAVQK